MFAVVRSSPVCIAVCTACPRVGTFYVPSRDICKCTGAFDFLDGRRPNNPILFSRSSARNSDRFLSNVNCAGTRGTKCRCRGVVDWICTRRSYIRKMFQSRQVFFYGSGSVVRFIAKRSIPAEYSVPTIESTFFRLGLSVTPFLIPDLMGCSCLVCVVCG